MDSTLFLDSHLASDEKEIRRILEKISNIYMSDDPEILNWVDTILPKWKVTQTRNYATEYRLLEKGWHQFCDQRKIEPNHIVIVNFIPENKEIYKYQILWSVYSELNKDGNIVRKHSELTVCQECEDAILTKSVVERIQNIRKNQNTPTHENMIVPDEWNPKCMQCLKN